MKEKEVARREISESCIELRGVDGAFDMPASGLKMAFRAARDKRIKEGKGYGTRYHLVLLMEELE